MTTEVDLEVALLGVFILLSRSASDPHCSVGSQGALSVLARIQGNTEKKIILILLGTHGLVQPNKGSAQLFVLMKGKQELGKPNLK